MESSRKSRSIDLVGTARAVLKPIADPGASILLALSGGVDSVVLLDVLSRLARELRFSLRAVHVHHGISPNADRWSKFCATLCASKGIPFALERVDISSYRDLGVEGAARQARYEALSRHEADFVALAQHRDDQVETVLLQLARGAGARGLGGMAPMRSMTASSAKLVRPFLGVSRLEIEAHALAAGLQWVEDESNVSHVMRRNFLRSRVIPELEGAFPEVRAAMVRSARHLAEAGLLLDELADEDLASIAVDDALDVRQLVTLRWARARNALRRWCAVRLAPWPGSARLAEILRQAGTANPDAVLEVRVRGWAFRRYRGLLFLDRLLPDVQGDFVETWHGERSLPLLPLGGVLQFRPETGRGVSAARLRLEKVSVRLRTGGERIRLHPHGRRRTLKNLFQEKGVKPWLRTTLPLVYCGDTLVAVPYVGEAADWRAEPEEPGVIVSWEPFRPLA
jgi:tRNA(Ile)-lysidine synthase